MDWVFRLKDLPEQFEAYSDSVKRVIRPIYNAMLMHFMDEEKAIAETLKNMAARGFSPSTEKLPH